MPQAEIRGLTQMGPVRRHLVEEILTKKVRKYGVVVWYDPAQAFEAVAEGLSIERTKVVRWQGSFYRLRHEAEEVFQKLDRGSVAVEEGIVIYVNAQPPDKQIDVLLGLEKAGTRFDWSLAAVARDALKNLVSRETLDSWLSNPRFRLEDIDRLANGEVPADRTAVALVFETTAPTDVAVRYLGEADLTVEIDKRGVLPALLTLLSSALGLAVEGIKSEEQFRKRLSRHILMTEFISGFASGALPSALSGVPIAGTSAQVEVCRRVAAGLRDRWRSREEYAAVARSVESEFSLRSISISAGSLISYDTFPFQEEILLHTLDDLAVRGEIGTALDQVKERGGAFWSIVDPVRAVQWRTAETALSLCREAGRVWEEVKHSKASPEVLARNYAQGEDGRGRWYQMDSLERRLEWLVATADCELGLSGMLKVARERYRQAATGLADRFAQSIRAGGFTFGSVQQQTDTFARVIRPAMDRGPVAYFLISGLRYEMAVELLDSLSFVEGSEVQPAVAGLPSISSLGLCALLPGAEGGVAIRERASGFVVEVGGNVFSESGDRLRFLRRRFGDSSVVDLPLADLLTKRTDALRKKLEGKTLVVVRSPEIDTSTIEGGVLQARKSIGDLLGDVRRGIRRVGDLGIPQVVLASSTGYLLSWTLDDPSVEPPDGHTLDVGSRFWVGKGGGDRADYIRFKASDLALGGDLEFAFPKGLSLFKTKRELMPYVSGGISPQELVVPVATITVAASGAPALKDQYELILGRERVSNRLFTVTLRYHKGSLLSGEDRRVRVVARSGKEDIGRAATAVHGFDQVTGEVLLIAGQENHVTIMLTSDVQRGALVVAIVDPDTEVTLKQTIEVPYDLSI
jgi:hypothetical protein